MRDLFLDTLFFLKKTSSKFLFLTRSERNFHRGHVDYTKSTPEQQNIDDESIKFTVQK